MDASHFIPQWADQWPGEDLGNFKSCALQVWSFFDFDDKVVSELSEFVDEHLQNVYFVRVSMKVVICVLIMKNGFTITGEAGVIDPTKFDAAIGARFALRDAVRKAGQVVGFLNQQLKHEGKEWKRDTVDTTEDK